MFSLKCCFSGESLLLSGFAGTVVAGCFSPAARLRASTGRPCVWRTCARVRSLHYNTRAATDESSNRTATLRTRFDGIGRHTVESFKGISTIATFVFICRHETFPVIEVTITLGFLKTARRNLRPGLSSFSEDRRVSPPPIARAGCRRIGENRDSHCCCGWFICLIPYFICVPSSKSSLAFRRNTENTDCQAHSKAAL